MVGVDVDRVMDVLFLSDVLLTFYRRCVIKEHIGFLEIECGGVKNTAVFLFYLVFVYNC